MFFLLWAHVVCFCYFRIHHWVQRRGWWTPREDTGPPVEDHLCISRVFPTCSVNSSRSSKLCTELISNNLFRWRWFWTRSSWETRSASCGGRWGTKRRLRSLRADRGLQPSPAKTRLPYENSSAKITLLMDWTRAVWWLLRSEGKLMAFDICSSEAKGKTDVWCCDTCLGFILSCEAGCCLTVHLSTGFPCDVVWNCSLF